MEIDPTTITPHQLILQRLENLGVPAENLEQQYLGLIIYVKNNKSQIGGLVSALLPTNEDAMEGIKDLQIDSPGSAGSSAFKELFQESMIWLQWLMFEGEPRRALEHLANTGQHGVCGAVWGNNDIAYRCRTCEHDPTCAICVPCFHNGNHKDHDYSIIYTGGGCCDCGDATAWKREGFCSKHKGPEQIQPLPEEFANSLGPVLDSLLSCWRKSLQYAESTSEQSPRLNRHATELRRITDELTSAAVEMLLDFCKNSESLLSFISRRVFFSEGLLDVLVRAERFIVSGDIVRKLHELLFKLFGEPQFKYEFAKVFLSYYPTVVNEAIKEGNDTVFKKYPLLSTFSVQIFTVPTLIPRLVKEKNLLAMLLDCLGDILVSCSGENGRLKVIKWGNLYETTLRVVEDIRFVMSHSAVPRYVTRDRRDILRTWMKLLTFVQGVNPQKRVTGIEEENESMHLPFVLGRTITNVHSLLVGGTFALSSTEDSDDALFNTLLQHFENQDSQRHAKVGRLAQESSVSSVTGRSPLEHTSRTSKSKSDSFPVPSSVLWLTFECLRAIENWLGVDNTSGPLLNMLSPKTSSSSGNNFSVLKRTLSKFRRDRQVIRSNSPSNGIRLSSSTEGSNNHHSYPSPNRAVALDSGHNLAQETANLAQETAGFSGVDDSMLERDYAQELEALRVLSLSDWPDIAYKVGLQDISLHIPLHRLLSMILQRALRQCYGETVLGGSCSNSSSAIYQDFFGHILGSCHPHGFSAFIMEHALRIKVFCAQVHAGMWRRNVDAAILSCEWYRSVRWSEQSLELDLFLLQCCAALGPADLYVIRILERFELSDYLSLNLERSNQYEPTIVQEMLTLIIQIVKERRFCGLTPSECLQRELLYKLSIGDSTHSQLVKSLPRDLSKADELQEVLDRIAVYSNPSGMNQGMYKLRTSYWKELDLYHPRWNSKELQVAEERYMRFCNVSALTSQVPKWTNIYPPLRGIAQIATCRTVLQIVRAVVFYAVFTDKSNISLSRAPDGVLLTALHLLFLALDVCCVHRQSGDCSCYEDDVIPILALASEELSSSKYGDQSLLSLLVLLMRKYRKENDFVEAGIFNLSSVIESLLKKFAELQPGCKINLQDLAPEVVNQLSQSVSTGDSNSSKSVSGSDKRKAKARERQAAIMEVMRAQQSKFLKSIDSSVDAGSVDCKLGKESSDLYVKCNAEEATPVICSLCHDPNSISPLSYLILLQKSRLLTFTNRGPLSWEQAHNYGKEPASCAKRMTNISSQWSILSTSPEARLTQSIQNAIDDFALKGKPKEVKAFIKYVMARFPAVENIQLPCTSSIVDEDEALSLEMLEEQMYSLIWEKMGVNLGHWDLLRSDKKLSTQGAGGSAESLLLGKYISALAGENLESPSASETAHNSQLESSMLLTTYGGFGPSDCDGIYLSSCGHAVHQGCLDRYLLSLKERYTRRMVFEGGHIVDPDQGEFLCPVCRGLANSVLPALPPDSGRLTVVGPSDDVPLPSPSGAVDALRFKEALFLLQSAADVAGSREILQRLPFQKFGRMRANFEPVYRALCGMYFPDKDKILESGRFSHSLILYDTLKYSLISMEIAARSGKTSLAPNYTLDTLFKELQSSNGFIMALLLSIAQSTRTMNSLTVLLRLRGIQLFAQSICSDASVGEILDPTVGGHMQDILECTETEYQYPDIQFWRWSSDPILAHDAFSSLMWIIYCLPSRLLSCEDAFLSLVQLFYVVVVTQAIITYWRKRQCSLLELGYNDSLVTDIYKVFGEHGVAHKYFDSNFLETSYDIKDAIRSLTFPYMRRCALLWKLIHSSRVVPFGDGTNKLDRSGSTYEPMDCGIAVDLIQIEELEKILKIPSLDHVLHDVTIRLVVQKWVNHFYKQFETHGLKDVLYSNPATPFKMMLLPHLYQDLLQRYIKQKCPDCRAFLKNPALCLFCGKLCLPNMTCCRESGCQTHAIVCGAGTGVFLLIRNTTILLQRSARQSPWPSLYLDAFGEEDYEMHRGKPLYLNEERYAALNHMVASHGLDRSSKVLRQTTIGALFML